MENPVSDEMVRRLTIVGIATLLARGPSKAVGDGRVVGALGIPQGLSWKEVNPRLPQASKEYGSVS